MILTRLNLSCVRKEAVGFLILLSAFLYSANTYSQCTKAPRAFGGFYPDKTCSPVTVEVLDNSGIIPGNIATGTIFSINWGDGSAVEVWVAPSNNVSLPVGQFVHTYNSDSCVYHPLYQVSNPCGKDKIFGVINVWDTENRHKAVAEQFDLCVGEEGFFTFHDGTQFNCQTPPPDGNIHDSTRTITWRYGTTGSTLSMDPLRGINVTAPGLYGDGIYDIPGEGWLEDSTHYKTSSEGTASGLVHFPAGSTTDADTGKIFEVTIRLWNDCNQYPFYAPVEASSFVRIVSRPAQPTAPSAEYCVGGTILPLSATGADVRWYNDSLLSTELFAGNSYNTGVSNLLPSLNTYWVTQRNAGSAGCESYPKKVTLRVWPSLIAGVIGNAQTICFNTAPASLSLSTLPSGGNGSYSYLWQVATALAGPYADIAGETGSSYVPPVLIATRYYRLRIVSGPCQEYSLPVTITVTPATTAGTIASNLSICEGTDPAGFTQTVAPTGGTGAYTYQWQGSPDNVTFSAISGAISPTFNEDTLYATQYYRRIVSSGGCAIASNVLTITVTPALLAGDIAGTSFNCSSGIPNFTSLSPASGGNGIGSYTYKWQRGTAASGPWTDLGGTNSTVYTDVALAVTRYYRRFVTSGSCTAFTDTVALNVTPSLTAGSIGSSQTICVLPGDASQINQITAPTGGNGAGSYTYQWQSSLVSGIGFSDLPGEINPFYDPAAGLAVTTYFRRVTQSAYCILSSNEVQITINALVNAGSIAMAGPNDTICSGSIPSSITEITAATGGTGVFSHQWLSSPFSVGPFGSIAGATLNTYAPPALSSTQYYIRRVSSGVCPAVETAPVQIEVEQPLNSGSIGSNQALCAPADPDPITEIAPATGGRAPYTYSWKESNNALGPFAAIVPAENGLSYNPPVLLASRYYIRTASGGVCPSVNSNVVSSIITNSFPGAAGAISGPDSVCQGNSGVFSIAAVPFAATYTWTVPAGASIIGRSDTSFITVSFVGTGTGQIKVTPVNGCGSGAFATRNVKVNPGPIINLLADTSFCPGESHTFVFSSSTTTGESYSWVNSKPGLPGAGGIGLAASGTGNVVYAAPLNLTGNAIQGQISVTASKNGCTSIPMAFRISSKPKPLVNATANLSYCPAQNVTVTPFSSNTVGESYKWFNNNAGIGLAASGTGNIPFYTAPANVSGTAFTGNIKLVATLNNCISDTSQFTLSIQPKPVLSLPVSDSACPAEMIGPYTFGSNVAGTSYSWGNNNTSIGLGNSGAGSIGIFAAGGNVSGTYFKGIITVVGTANSCASDPAAFDITVRPKPVITNKSNFSSCPATLIDPGIFDANTGAGTSYSWTNSNSSIGIPASGSSHIGAFTSGANSTGGNLTASINVLATADGCISSPMTFGITVKPKPVVDDQPDISVCPGNTVSPLAFTSNTAGTSYTWTNSNSANGLLISGIGDITSYIAPTNISGLLQSGKVLVTGAASGCFSDTIGIFVSVKPTPVLASVTVPDLCPGDLINPGPFSTNVPSPSYSWNNTNTLIGLPASGTDTIGPRVSLPNISGSNRTGTVTVIASKNGCNSTALVFTINVKPTPVLTPLPNYTFCPGVAVSTAIFTSSVAGADISWTNSAPGAPPTGIGLDASGVGNIIPYAAPLNITGTPIIGNISVSAIKNSCSSAPMNFNITLKAKPVIDSVADISVCPNESISVPSFTANTGALTTFTWSNNSTSTGLGIAGAGNIPSFTSSANISGGTYTSVVSLIASKDACSSNTFAFRINDKPKPVIGFQPDIDKCPGDSVIAEFLSNVPGPAYSWTNSNTGIGLGLSGAGSIRYMAPANHSGGTFMGNIAVDAVYNGCLSDPRLFRIFIKPTPDLVPTADYAFCPGALVGIPGFTTNTPGPDISWRHDNPAIGLFPMVGSGSILTYLAPEDTSGNQTAKVIVTATENLCSSTPDTFNLTIYGKPVVFDQPDIAVCPGSLIAPLSFTGNLGGLAYSWVNNQTGIGIGGSGTGPIGAWFAPVNNTTSDFKGTITVTANKNGCFSNGVPFQVTVHPTPQTVLNTTLVQECITADDFFSAGIHPNAAYQWNVPAGMSILEGGDSINYIRLQFNAAGTFSLGVTERNFVTGCIGTTKNKSIVVNPKPVISIVTADNDVCRNESNVLYEVTDHPGSTYSWEVPADASIVSPLASNIRVSFNTQSGIIRVRETNAAGCPGDYDSIPVTVHEIPSAAFDTSDQTVCSGGITNFHVSMDTTINTMPTSQFSFSYTVLPVTGVTALPSSGTNLPHHTLMASTILNSNTSQKVANFRIIPQSPFCAAPPVVFPVNVNPKPNIKAIQPKTICSGSMINLLLETTTQPTSSISFNVLSAAQAGLTGNRLLRTGVLNGDILQDTITNSSRSLKIVTYKIVPQGFGCSGDTLTVVVSVLPVPDVVPSSLIYNICDGQAPAVTLSTTVSPADSARFDITVSNTGGISGYTPVINGKKNGYIISETLDNPTDVLQNAIYTITPKYQSCSGVPVAVTIPVAPEPKVNLSTLSQDICAGTAMNIQVSTSTIPTDSVSFTMTVTDPNGFTSGYTTPVSGLKHNNTINYTLLHNRDSAQFLQFSFLPRLQACTGLAKSATIKVNPIPDVVITPATQLICDDQRTSIQLRTNTKPVSSVTFSYTVSSIGVTGYSPSVSGLPSPSLILDYLNNTLPAPSNVTYVVTPSGNGCTGLKDTAVVTVSPKPNILTAAIKTTLCDNDTARFRVWSTTLPKGSVSFKYYVIGKAGISGHPVGLVTGVSDSSIIQHRLRNSSNLPQTIKYVLFPSGPVCTGDSVIVDVVVNPIPNVFPSVSKQTICSETLTSINLLSTTQPTGNVNFSYTATPVVPGSITGYALFTVNGLINNSTITENLQNKTLNPQKINYLVVPTANGCFGNDTSIEVTVNPSTRVVSSDTLQTICNASAVDISLLTATVPSDSINFTYTVAASAGVTGMSAGAGKVGYLITDTLKNSTLFPQLVTYQVTPYYNNSCPGKVHELVLTVNPIPDVQPIYVGNVCDNSSANILLTTNTNPKASVTFDYVVSATGSVTGLVPGMGVPNNTTIADILQNSANNAGLARYTITPSISGCMGAPVLASISVKPRPTVSSLPASATICSNDLVTLQLSSTNLPLDSASFRYTVIPSGGIYKYKPPVVKFNGQSISDSLVNPATSAQNLVYQVTPQFEGCEGSPINIPVTVNPEPVVTAIGAPQTICSGTASSVTLVSSTFTTPAVSFDYTASAPLGGITGLHDSTGISNNGRINRVLINTSNAPRTVQYLITPRAAGCSGPSITAVITVNPTPLVIPSVFNDTLCSKTATNFTISSPTTSLPLSFDYDASSAGVFGFLTSAVGLTNGTAVQDTLENFTRQNQQVTYRITPRAAGCTGSAVNVVMLVHPIPDLSPSIISQSICSDGLTNFTVPTTALPKDSVYFDYTTSTSGLLNIATPTDFGLKAGSAVKVAIGNTSNDPRVASFVMIPRMYGCAGESRQVDVTVEPVPRLLLSDTVQSICDKGNPSIVLSTPTSPTASITFSYFTKQTGGLSGYSLTRGGLVQGDTLNSLVLNSRNTQEILSYYLIPGTSLCKGDTVLARVKVNPTPKLSLTPANSTICDENFTNIQASTVTVPAASVKLNFTATATGNPGDVTGFTVSATNLASNYLLSEQLFNLTPTPVPQRVSYLFTPVSTSGCTGSVVPADVTINPKPVLEAGPDQVICSNAQADLSATAEGSYTSVQWSGGNGTYINKSSLTTIYYPVASDTLSIQKLIIKASDASNICASVKDSLMVTVRPAPVVDAGPNRIICVNQPAVLSGFAKGNYSKARWSIVSSGTGSFLDSTSVKTSYIPSANDAGLFITLRLTLTDAAGICQEVSDEMTITVNGLPLPYLESSFGGNALCFGEAVTYTAFNAREYEFFVNGISLQDSSRTSKFTHTFDNGDQLWVRGTSAQACSNNSDTLSILVNPLPVVGISSSDADNIICISDDLTFTGHGAETYIFYKNTRSSVVYTGTDPFDVSTLKNGESYFLQGIDTNGCRNYSDTINVIVRDLPGAKITSPDLSFCDNGLNQVNVALKLDGTGPWDVIWKQEYNTVTVIDTLKGISTNNYSFTVSNIQANHTYGLIGVTEYNGAVCEGNPDPKGMIVRVFENPMPEIEAGAYTTNAGTDTLTINVARLGGNGNYPDTAYGFIANRNLLSDYRAKNFYTRFQSNSLGDFELIYRLKDTRGCIGFDTTTVHVVISPISVNFIRDTINICPNASTKLNGLDASGKVSFAQVGGGSGRYGFAWEGDIGFIDDPTNRFPTFRSQIPGTYRFRFVVSDSLVAGVPIGIDSLEVTVLANPLINFAQDTLFTCYSETQVLDGHVTGGSGIYEHRWTGLGNLISDLHAANPVFNSPSNSTYRLDYEATAVYYFYADTVRCQVSDSMLVMNEAPKADFYSDASFKGECSPARISMFIQPVNSSSYHWDYGDGVQSGIVTGLSSMHVFNNQENYNVNYFPKLTAYSEHGCSHTDSINILVFAIPDYDFIPADTFICSEERIQFTSRQGAAYYFWQFGDEPEVRGPYYYSEQFINPGIQDTTFRIRLSVITDQNCKDTIDHSILVHPMPVADFNVVPDQLIYPETTVNIVNNNAVPGYTYEWNFGDGSDSLLTLNPGSYTYPNWGDYSLRLRAFTNWCESYKYRDVRIIPPVPIASFTTDTLAGCPPLKIAFRNTSQFSDAYTWDFGDEQTKSGKDQVYTYDVPGQYMVSLIARGDGGADTIANTFVTVYENPEIIFSFDPSTVTAPGLVTFTDSSRNVVEWVWEFGTGDTSHLRQPVYTYREEGSWDVTLTATSEHLCQQTKTVREAVIVKKDVELRVANAFTPNQFGPPAQPLTGDDLALNFNAVFIPQHKGVDENHYTFQIFNRWGEQLFETKDIRIGWDGYFKGKLCPQGVYVWKVKYRSLDGQGFEKMGDVTLYR